MAKRNPDHVHKYHKVKLGKHVVYKCALGGCPHYIRKELVEGRISICWICDEPFQITKVSSSLLRPHCISCTKSQSKTQLDSIKEFFENSDT